MLSFGSFLYDTGGFCPISSGLFFDDVAIIRYHNVNEEILHSLRAIFFRGIVNMHLHFMSFLHIDLTHVVEILPRVRQ